MTTTSTTSPPRSASDPRTPPGATGYIDFDVHGLVSIRVDRRAPTLALMRQMLGPFLTEEPAADPDIRIEGGTSPPARAARAEHEYLYTADSIYLNVERVLVRREDDGFVISGQRELLTYLLPLLDWMMVRRGAAMIHAGTFTYRGVGVAMPAWGGVGKTSMMARLAQIDDAAVMGDDWAFVRSDGTLLGYAKPMYIKPHHRQLYSHLFDGAHKPLVPSLLTKPLSQFATMVHPIMERFPRLASATRRWSPEHLTVTPHQALPHANFADSAPLGAAVFVERTEEPGVRMEEQDSEWMVRRILGNFHAELPRVSRDLVTALGATGILPQEELFTRKAEVVRQALHGVPCALLGVPQTDPAEVAARIIVERLTGVVDGARGDG